MGGLFEPHYKAPIDKFNRRDIVTIVIEKKGSEDHRINTGATNLGYIAKEILYRYMRGLPYVCGIHATHLYMT